MNKIRFCDVLLQLFLLAKHHVIDLLFIRIGDKELNNQCQDPLAIVSVFICLPIRRFLDDVRILQTNTTTKLFNTLRIERGRETYILCMWKTCSQATETGKCRTKVSLSPAQNLKKFETSQQTMFIINCSVLF